MKDTLPKKNLLGVSVTDASETEVLEFIVRSLKESRKKLHIATVNPEIIVLANKDEHFRSVLNRASLGLSDGLGVILAGKFLKKNLKDRVTGTDLMENLCEKASKEGFVVGFLGGRAKIAEKTSECLQRKYPGLKVGFVGEEWPERPGKDDRRSKMEDSTLKIEGRKSINPPSSSFKKLPSIVNHPSSAVDILFVAFGFPKQEFWIDEHLEKIPVRAAMGVGGAFDYMSGSVPRAPKWLRSIGLEWLVRLLVQPWRWRRQRALIEFIRLVLKELFAKEKGRIHN